MVHELEQDSIRPAEAVLYGILATGRQCIDVLDVIFLKQPACLAVNVKIILYPTFRTEIGFVCETIVLKSCENDLLQRRPAIGCVPLLPAIIQRRYPTTGLEKFCMNPCGNPTSLVRGSEIEKQREGSGK